jgi:hypothetical protein
MLQEFKFYIDLRYLLFPLVPLFHIYVYICMEIPYIMNFTQVARQESWFVGVFIFEPKLLKLNHACLSFKKF